MNELLALLKKDKFENPSRFKFPREHHTERLRSKSLDVQEYQPRSHRIPRNDCNLFRTARHDLSEESSRQVAGLMNKYNHQKAVRKTTVINCPQKIYINTQQYETICSSLHHTRLQNANLREKLMHLNRGKQELETKLRNM